MYLNSRLPGAKINTNKVQIKPKITGGYDDRYFDQEGKKIVSMMMKKEMV